MPYKQISTIPRLPPNLKSPILTDNLGLPRYWALAWASLVSKNLAESTEMKRLRYIEALYVFCDELQGIGGLDDLLGSGNNIEELAGTLEAYFISLRNKEKVTEASQKQWQAGLAFVKDVLTLISKVGVANSRLTEVERRLLSLNALYGQLRIKKPFRPDILRSLPASVVGHLYETLDPESSMNPFVRERTRWTAYLSFILMLHQGMRRGEILLLPSNAVKSSFDERIGRLRYWIRVEKIEEYDEQDTRHNRPSIKTSNSIRQVPVTENTAKIIQIYMENYRGRPDHPFLLNTQWNTPISHDSLTAYFSKISSALPPSVRQTLIDRNGKKKIEPHDLRHTCAVVRLSHLLSMNVPMDEAMQQMRTFFGWSRTSDMPQKYARAVFEDRLSSVWNSVIDDRHVILKSIPKAQS